MSTRPLLLQAATKNAEILQDLSQTDYARPALVQSSAHLRDLDKEIEDCDRQIEQLKARTSKELGDHRKYEESTMRRFFYRASGKEGKFEEEASKEREEYIKARNAETHAKSRRQTWVQNRETARRSHAKIEDDVKKHNDLQAKLDTLYDLIFAGHTPDVPGEDACEWAFREARDAFDAAKQRSEAELQVVKCLEDANNLMQQAVQQLVEALDQSTLDMFGRHTSRDMMQRDALNEAQDATNRVHMLVSQARRLSPGAQGLSLTNVAEEHVISDVFFHNINILSDVAMHENISRTRSQCEQEAKKIQGYRKSAERRSHQCGLEADEAAERLESCRHELQEIRQEAFAEAALLPSYEQSCAFQQNA